jgi:2-C-methyl-D-erythritol 4-phosphate cytidylyltransferase
MVEDDGTKTVAIIAAAGKGTRMAAAVPKVMAPVGGRPLLVHTLRAFEQANRVDGVVLVVTEQLIGVVAHEVVDVHALHKVSKIVSGGATRQESVNAGLQALDSSCGLVAIHDGVRPLITPDIIDLVVEQADQHGAAALAVRPKDTIKRGDQHHFLATLDRSKLWQTQTPQVFRHQLILEAHRRAAEQGYRGTDDASLVEAMGHKVLVVEGKYENIKVTTPEDLLFVEMVLQRRGDH